MTVDGERRRPFRLRLWLFGKRVLRSIDTLYYWLSHRTVDRYHIVPTGLAPGYRDVDEVMFRACFALLGRFVEGELGRAPVDAQPDQHYRWYRLHDLGGTDQAAIALWCWYCEQLPGLEAIDASRLPFDTLEQIKQDKLTQLIALRRTLWT